MIKKIVCMLMLTMLIAPLTQAQTQWKLTNAKGTAVGIAGLVSIDKNPQIIVANDQKAEVKLMEVTIFRDGKSIVAKEYTSNTFSLEKDFKLEKGDGVLVKLKKVVKANANKKQEIDNKRTMIAFRVTK